MQRKSWKVGVKTSQADEHWTFNQLRFPSYDMADEYGRNLMSRWTLVIAYHICSCNDVPNIDLKLGANGDDY